MALAREVCIYLFGPWWYSRMLFAEVVCIIVVIFTNLFGDPQNLIQTCCWFLLCHRLTETVSTSTCHSPRCSSWVLFQLWRKTPHREIWPYTRLHRAVASMSVHRHDNITRLTFVSSWYMSLGHLIRMPKSLVTSHATMSSIAFEKGLSATQYQP